jgi:hypothetical protein
MKKNKQNIPFFESCDENHCFQACLKMVLAYWLPNREFSFEELDKLSGHKAGKWTWQGKTILYLIENDFEVVNIENLDYQALAEKGEKYLTSIWTKEVFNIQKKYSDLAFEQQVAQKLIKNKKIILKQNEAEIEDIFDLFNKNYTILVSVNPYTIRNEDGYASHMVVITSLDEKNIIIHDPGPPGFLNKKINRNVFEKAMTKPAKEDTNILAIKLLHQHF